MRLTSFYSLIYLWRCVEDQKGSDNAYIKSTSHRVRWYIILQIAWIELHLNENTEKLCLKILSKKYFQNPNWRMLCWICHSNSGYNIVIVTCTCIISIVALNRIHISRADGQFPGFIQFQNSWINYFMIPGMLQVPGITSCTAYVHSEYMYMCVYSCTCTFARTHTYSHVCVCMSALEIIRTC